MYNTIFNVSESLSGKLLVSIWDMEWGGTVREVEE